MKFTRKPTPRIMSERTKSGFLWLPKTLRTSDQGNQKETRWLEKASWMEIFYVSWYPWAWKELTK